MRTLHAELVFDWYDGVVLALGHLSGNESACIVSLLAFDTNTKHRAYALLRVGESELAWLRTVADEDWERQRSALETTCRLTNGEATVAVVDESGSLVHERSVDVADLRRDLLLDIEEATDPSRLHWLHEPC